MRLDEAEHGRGSGGMARVLLAAIRVYQLTLSGLIGRRCRHLPTCSDYAMEAVGLHGAWRGSWLAIARMQRCHPWGSEGFDPVPRTLPEYGWRGWRYGRWRL